MCGDTHGQFYDLPVFPCDSLKKPIVGARGDAVHSVVGAYERGNPAPLNASLEGRHVRVHEVLLSHGGVDVLAVFVVPVLRGALHLVGDEVLAARTGLEVAVIVRRLLEASDISGGVLAGLEGVLQGNLNVSPPARLPRKVNHRRPER